MEFIFKTFSELSNEELYSLLQLRSEVFVVEQKCAYQDLDGKDSRSLHLMGYSDKELVAYTRIVPPGISYPEPAIGRVVVSPKSRGKEFGKDVMNESMTRCFQLYGKVPVIISAQLYLERFYTELGFVRESEVYPEDDIPHIKMRYTPAP